MPGNRIQQHGCVAEIEEYVLMSKMSTCLAHQPGLPVVQANLDGPRFHSFQVFSHKGQVVEQFAQQ